MLADLSLTEMLQFVKEKALPAFRGKQIFDAIYLAKSIAEVTNLPASLLQQLKMDYPTYRIVQKHVGQDGTIKYINQMGDGEIVESVLMQYKYGSTLCVSTQVGCRMGCQFCASTLHGLIRNLSAGEILGQVLLANRDLGGTLKERKITNIVLMGSGEPLDNFDAVAKFLYLVSAENGIQISQRNISLSTCGLVPEIYKLADAGYHVTLTISLHASNDEIRRRTMPIANRYTMEEIIKSCRYYIEKTGRRVIFEYTLIKGVNDRQEHAKELALKLRGMQCHVNVIPLNEVKERNLVSPTRKDAYVFAGLLEKEGISATVRRTMGEDIGGACGQLRNQIINENKNKLE